jgi:hypothetical protein
MTALLKTMRHSHLKLAVVSFILAAFLCSAQSTEPGSASLCVAPSSDDPVVRCAPGLCGSGKISFKIDDQPVIPWPKAKSMKISDLDAAVKHRVVIYRAGKRQQSFRFHFSQFKENEACLFLNDLYWTAQLWDPKGAPWCKCK